jgi:outer membrane protein/adhesin transport system outer membrane protein
MIAASRTTLGAVAAAAVLGAASPAPAENLVDALARAYSTSLTLEAERAGLRAQDEAIAAAAGALRPDISLTAAVTRSNVETRTTRTQTVAGQQVLISNRESVNSTPAALTLSVSQMLYRGAVFDGIRQVEASSLASRARLIATEQQVLSSAMEAYVNLLRDQAVLQLNRSSEQVLQAQLEAARDRFRLGAATRTDIAQAESRVSAAAVARIQAEGQLAIGVATYRQVVGAPPGDLDTPAPLAGLPDSLAESIEVALAEHPTLASAEFALLAADRGVDVAIGGLLPTAALSASSRRSADWFQWGRRTFNNSIGVTLSVPLYQRGAEYSGVRRAKQSQAQARIALGAARQQIEAQVTQSWQVLATARAAIFSRSDQVRASELALEGVRREEEVGARTQLDVLNAEQELLNARVALVTSRRDEIVASYTLQAAMGRLTAAYLDLPVERYDPAANFARVRGAWIGLD